VISIDGLRALADRLSRLDVGRTEADALDQAARDIEAAVKAIASFPPSDEAGTRRRGRETAASAVISHRITEHCAVIGAAGHWRQQESLGPSRGSPIPF